MLFSKGSSLLLTLWCLFLCFPRSSSMFLLFESRAFLFMYEEKSPTAWRKKKCMQIWCSFPPVCAILRAPKSSDRFHNEKRRRHNLYTHPPFFVFALHMSFLPVFQKCLSKRVLTGYPPFPPEIFPVLLQVSSAWHARQSGLLVEKGKAF